MALTEQRKRELDALMNKSSTPTSKPNTGLSEQRKRELDVLVERNKPKEGFLKGIAKEIISPFAKVGVSEYNVVKALEAVSQGKGYDVGQSRNLPFLGKVKPLGGIVSGQTATELAKATTRKIKGQETTIDQQKKINEAAKAQKEYGFKGVKESIGTGLEIGSYLPTGLAAKGVVKAGQIASKQPIKTAVVSSIKHALPEATIGGSLFGAGRAQQEDKGFKETAKETLKGGAYGAVGGVALGGGGALLGAGVRKTIGAGKALSEGKPGFINRAIDSLEDKYIEIASGTKRTKNKLEQAKLKTEWKNTAGTTGTDPARTLAELGIVPEQKGSRLNTLEQVAEIRTNSGKLNNINKTAIRELDGLGIKSNLNKLENEAVSKAMSPQNIDKGIADDLVKTIRKEFENFRKHYGDEITPTKLNEIKTERWGDTKFDIARPLKSDTNYLIAKTAQKEIEKIAEASGYKEVAQLNRTIGDRLEAAKFLETLDSKVLKGGRLQGYIFGAIGSSLGNTPLGKILGYMGGDALSNILISQSVSGPIKRLILRDLRNEAPEVAQKAEQWLIKNRLHPNQPLMLPEGRLGTPTGNINLPQRTPRLAIAEVGALPQPYLPPQPQVARPGQKLLPEKASSSSVKPIITRPPTTYEKQASKINYENSLKPFVPPKK